MSASGVKGRGAALNNPNFSTLTLSHASQLARRKKISPVELTQACLDRTEQLNPKLNAFITVTADSALAEAREAEAEIHRGRWKGPLHGIPIALKDLVDTAGVRTTAARKVAASQSAPEGNESAGPSLATPYRDWIGHILFDIRISSAGSVLPNLGGEATGEGFH